MAGIVEIVFGIDTLDSDEQNWNAYLPIETTVDGMIIFCRDVQEENAASPITFTVVGMTTSIREEHP